MIHPSFIVKVKNSLLSFVQYGCVIHCFFEHIAELAIVSILINNSTFGLKKKKYVKLQNFKKENNY